MDSIANAIPLGFNWFAYKTIASFTSSAAYSSLSG